MQPGKLAILEGHARAWGRRIGHDPATQSDDQFIDPIAPRAELIGLFEHLERTLDRTGFFKTDDKRPAMVNNLRAAFARAQLSGQEIRTLRGVISSIDRVHLRHGRLARKDETGEE